MKQLQIISTPCGALGIAATDCAVTDIFFGTTPQKEMVAGDSELLQQATRELEEYFAGTRRDFSFPIAAEGTPFQHKVWAALRTIPYGETRTYAQIATQTGNPKAARAVGMANNRNPLPIVVPCHRVIGTDGRLTGYAGGMATKELLLNLENQHRK